MLILQLYHHYNVFVESFKHKSNILHHVCVNEALEDSLLVLNPFLVEVSLGQYLSVIVLMFVLTCKLNVNLV